MSAEGLRDMRTMLAQLEADGPFDHTEGFFSNKHPGRWGTDFSGRDFDLKVAEIALLKRQLEEANEVIRKEKEAKEALQSENDGHQGTITTLQAETSALRRQVAENLLHLKTTSREEFNKLVNAFHTFQDDISKHVHDLEKRMVKEKK
jgi:hypothetical protein